MALPLSYAERMMPKEARKYPAEFIQRVMELYPDDKELRGALEAEAENVIEACLRDGVDCISLDTLDYLAQHGQIDEHHKAILLIKQRHSLYAEWIALSSRITTSFGR